MSQKFAKFLVERLDALNRAEGRSYTDPLTWTDLADRVHREAGLRVPVNNIIRWKNGHGVPGSLEYVVALAKVLGEDTFRALDLPPTLPPDLDPDLLWIIRHRHDPAVLAVIRQARELAGQECQDEQPELAYEPVGA